MKKGFTLIELLAVIVILAIIALIATPIVLNIINETKDSANLRSAEMYLNGVEQSMARSMLQNKYVSDGTYNITKDGDICLENFDSTNKICPDINTLKIEVEGEAPSGGSIDIKNGSIGSILLELNNNKMIKNDKGEVIMHPCTLVQDADNNNLITPGDEYLCKVDPNKEPYTFYVLSDGENGTTNLIMDSNINKSGVAIKSNDITDKGHVKWYEYTTVNSYGPVTAMNYLNNATSTWTNLENLNITYNDEGGHFTNFPITGKARLPYKREVYEVGCEDYSDSSCPVWMVDYLEDYDGYWTLSTEAGESNTNIACYVSIKYNVICELMFGTHGVRPVINVKL